MIHPFRRRSAHLLVIAGLLTALAGCEAEEEVAAPVIRPVRTITVAAEPQGAAGSFAGRVEAADHVSLAFRIGGRLAEREVEVGTVLEAGDPVARLEPQNERNAVRTARAALVGAEAAFTRADNAHDRHSQLLDRGVTSQAHYESVSQSRAAAKAEVEAASAQLTIAEEQLGFTELDADAPGVVTAVGAEPGEVVAAGQMIARVARDGGRDAVFDVPAPLVGTLGPGALMEVALTESPDTAVTGRVREVSPQADPVTRTFRVRVGLDEPPAAMRLGMGVTGTVLGAPADGFSVPISALKEDGGATAVFVVDPATLTLALRPVEIAARDPLAAHVVSGLSAGDVVVTAGVSVLQEGQKVRLLGAES